MKEPTVVDCKNKNDFHGYFAGAFAIFINFSKKRKINK